MVLMLINFRFNPANVYKKSVQAGNFAPQIT